MDRYIMPEALDANHPLYSLKIDNYKRACEEHADCAVNLKSLPSKIILQTTDLCNLHCLMCQLPKGKKRHSMSIEVFNQVVEQLFPTLIELHPTNVGEPLVSPWFDHLCDAMERFGVLLDITTNGALLNDKRIKKIVTIGRDIKISFDGSTQETFERLRPPSCFKTICNNVRKLREALDYYKPPRKVFLTLQMTILKSNFRELPEVIKLASQLGANTVKAYHLFSFSPEMNAESLMNDLELWTPILEKALEMGKLYNIELQLAEPILKYDQSAPDLIPTVCHLPWHEAWIDFDGSVYTCHSHGGKSAGNILHQHFSSIWNSNIYQFIRSNFAKNIPKGHCKNCGMNYLKKDEHQPTLYDKESFLSTPKKDSQAKMKWSSRMKPFDLSGRKNASI